MSGVPVRAAVCDGKPIGPADFGVEQFSVSAVLDRRAEQCPDRVMMSIDGVDVTFEQMRRRSAAAARVLVDMGTGPGDGVALFAGTCPHWVYFCLGGRGENISSVEVESVVTRHPAVLEAAVVGVPSDVGEDDILLVIVVQPGAELDYVELLDFCSAQMPYFAVPRYVEIASELPKTVIGRIRKDVLRARGVGPAAWDRDSHGYIVSR